MAESKLPADIFDREVKNHQLIKQAYETYLANSRMANATTLKRGEVRGGGKKPWRQKGTGRARFGSSRNPIWRGGGIAFGPNGEQNFKLKMAKRDKRIALIQALSLANQGKLIHQVEIKTTGKTSEVAKFLADNKYVGRVVIVTGVKTPELIRATSNIDNVVLVTATYLNVYYVINADAILIDPSGLKAIEKWLSSEEA